MRICLREFPRSLKICTSSEIWVDLWETARCLGQSCEGFMPHCWPFSSNPFLPSTSVAQESPIGKGIPLYGVGAADRTIQLEAVFPSPWNLGTRGRLGTYSVQDDLQPFPLHVCWLYKVKRNIVVGWLTSLSEVWQMEMHAQSPLCSVEVGGNVLPLS